MPGHFSGVSADEDLIPGVHNNRHTLLDCLNLFEVPTHDKETPPRGRMPRHRIAPELGLPLTNKEKHQDKKDQTVHWQ